MKVNNTMGKKWLLMVYLSLLISILFLVSFVFVSASNGTIDNPPISPTGSNGYLESDTNHLKYYGYYHAQDSRYGLFMEDIYNYTNVIHLSLEDSGFKPEYIDNAAELGLKTILELHFYIDRGSWDRRLSRLKGYIEEGKINSDNILVLYLIDEPSLNGWNSSLLNEAVEKVAEYFPDKLTMVNFVSNEINPPQSLDWIAIDPYFYPYYTDGCEQREKYDGRIARLLPWAKSFNKPILILGQSFERTSSSGNYAPMPSPCQQNWYYETAKSEQSIIGLLWFMYGNASSSSESIIGTNAFPEVINLHKQIGGEIFANLGNEEDNEGNNWDDDEPILQIYEITPEELKKGITKELVGGEKIKFSINQQNHTLIINKVFQNNVDITFQSEQTNLTIYIYQEKKLNLTSSEYYDLRIRLNSVVGNVSNITLQEIKEDILNQSENVGASLQPEDTTDEGLGDTSLGLNLWENLLGKPYDSIKDSWTNIEDKSLSRFFIIAGIVLIVFLIIILVFIFYKNTHESYSP